MPASSFDPIIRGHLDKTLDALAQEFDGVYDREHCRALVHESASNSRAAPSTCSCPCSLIGLPASAS